MDTPAPSTPDTAAEHDLADPVDILSIRALVGPGTDSTSAAMVRPLILRRTNMPDLSVASWAPDALHYPDHLVTATYPDRERAVFIVWPIVGLRRLPRPLVRGVPEGDWVTFWETGHDALALAQSLGHLTPSTQVCAALAVAELAVHTVDGHLHTMLSTALDAGHARVRGAVDSNALQRMVAELYRVRTGLELDRAPTHKVLATEAVASALNVAEYGWMLDGIHTRAGYFVQTVQRTIKTLDADPWYADVENARLAALRVPAGEALPPRHPEIAKTLRTAIGDDVYTQLPSTPVRVP